MNLSRVRTIIIAVLLLINIGLAVFWYSANSETTKLPADMIRHAVKNLGSMGVSVTEDSIPENVPKNDIFSYEVKPITLLSGGEKKYRYADRLAAFFLSRDTLKNGEKSQFSYFEVPKGISINLEIVKNDGKISEFANITCSDDFGFEYAKIDFDKTLLPKKSNSIRSKKPVVPKNTAITIDSFFNLFNDNYKKSEYLIVDYQKTDAGEAVICRQTLSQTVLFGMELCFFINKDKQIVSVSGKWCFESFVRKYSNTLIDGVNILYQLSGKEDIKVISESIVYMPIKYAEQKYYFIPAWSVIYKDKNNHYGNTIFEALEGTKMVSNYIDTVQN